MKRIILGLLITLFCALSSFAQAKNVTKQVECALAIDRSPELRGFRLGAAQSSVLARFPGTSIGKPDKFGNARMRLTVFESADVSKTVAGRGKGVLSDMTAVSDEESGFIIDSARFPELKGVRRVRVRFTDGRLSLVQIAYDDSISWESVDSFVETVAQTLKLSGTWNIPDDSDGSTRERELRCAGFVITGAVGGDSSDTRIGPQLTVEDLTARKLAEKRQSDLKEKAQRDEDAKRKNFKP